MNLAKFNGAKTVAYLYERTMKPVMTRIRLAKPEIALGVGIVGLAAGTILACTKTKQAVDVIEETKDELEDIKICFEEEEKLVDPDVSDDERADILKDLHRDCFKDKAAAYWKASCKLGKIYAVPILLWSGGLSSIIFAHADLKHQNSKLLLDSMAFKKFVDEYRERIRREIGDEKEKELYFGAEEDEFEVTEVDPETGNYVKKRVKSKKIPKDSGSMFARNFNQETSYAFDARSYASYFIELHVEHLNKKLKSVPFLTVNDLYDEFNMKPAYGRCKEGLDWGWAFDPLDPENPNNKIIVTWLEGHELVKNEYSGEYEWLPSLRFDINPQPLKEIL